MKAIEFDRFGSVEVLQLRDVAEPAIRPDEVLVRVAASSVNPKDTFTGKSRRSGHVEQILAARSD